MCKQKAVSIVLLIIAIAGICFADYSIVKIPMSLNIADYACTDDDYIWYTAFYDNGRYIGIGRLHVPSQKGMFFTGDEIGRSPSNISGRMVVVDSSYAAFLSGASVYYYNGTKWDYSTYPDGYRDLLAIPSTGKLWLLSSYSIVIMDKSGNTITIMKDSIGLSDPLISFAKDISENVWVISNTQIARYDNISWKVMAQNDSMNFSRIDITLEGKTCFLSNGRYYTLVDGHLDTLPLPVHVRNSNSNADESGNQWNHQDSAMDVSLQMVTSDKKNITFQNAKSFGWKNWPEFMKSTPDSAIRIWKKNVYFRYFNGFYRYSGDTNNLCWEWLPVNTSISRFDTIGVDKLLPSRDSSMYLVRLNTNYGIMINDVYKLKSNQFQSLPPVKFVNSSDVYEARNGVLWAVGNRVYKLENSVWTRVTIPGIMTFGKVAEDNLGRILLFENIIVGDSSGKNENVRSILRQSGAADWEIINQTNANLPPGFGFFNLDSKGTYWVGTTSGIFKSKDLYQWTREDSTNFPGNYVTDLFVNSKGNIVAAVKNSGSSGAGSAVIQFDGNRWQNLGLPFESINFVKLCEDKEGRLWCGNIGDNPVLSYYDSNGWHKVEELSISELKTDSLNQLWFRLSGTRYLCKYTPGGNNPVVNKVYKNTKSPQLKISSTGVGNVKIMYTVSNPSDVCFQIFDLEGKSVQIIRKGFHNKGSYQLHWNYKNAKGVYLIRMSTHNSVYSTRFRAF